MTKCLNKNCKDCSNCKRFDPKAGYQEPVIYPSGTPDCPKYVEKNEAK